MWEYNNVLQHSGVRGMKWGVRKDRKIGAVGRATVTSVAKLHKTIGGVQKRSANAIKKDADSIRAQKSKMVSAKTKDGKSLFTEKDIDDMIKTLEVKSRKKELKALGHERFAKQLLSEIGQLKIRDISKK